MSDDIFGQVPKGWKIEALNNLSINYLVIMRRS